MARKNLSETELAYLAGLTDGEGCLTFSDNGTGCIRPLYQIIMTDEAIVRWVGDILGVYTRQFAKHRALPHHKDQFKVRLTGERAVIFLKLIHPYLRVKRPQAEVLIAWLDTKHMKNPERDLTRKEMKKQIHILNDDRRPAHMEYRKAHG